MERLAMTAYPRQGANEETVTTRFSARESSGVQVIRFARNDVLDATYIEQVGDEIYRFLKPIDAPRVVMDLGNVHALSSMALGMLIQLRKVVTERGGAIAVAGASPDIVKIFKVIRLNKLIDMYDSAESAVGKLA